jgi:hypothetical protein
MQKLGTRLRSFISENIYLEFSVQGEAWMCDSEASFLLVNHYPLVKVYRNLPPFKIGNTKTTFPTRLLNSLCPKTHLEISRLEQMFWTRFTSELEVAPRAPRANRTPFVRTEGQEYQLTNNWLW